MQKQILGVTIPSPEKRPIPKRTSSINYSESRLSRTSFPSSTTQQYSEMLESVSDAPKGVEHSLNMIDALILEISIDLN
jgi:hypothetical protein